MGIFLGEIKNWNDQKIHQENLKVKFPNQMITDIHRSDGSGTSFIFKDFLSKVSSTLKKLVGKSTSVNWLVGLGGKGNEGFAGFIKQTPGSIGYLELYYALENQMSVGKVKNQPSKFPKTNVPKNILKLRTLKKLKLQISWLNHHLSVFSPSLQKHFFLAQAFQNLLLLQISKPPDSTPNPELHLLWQN